MVMTMIVMTMIDDDDDDDDDDGKKWMLSWKGRWSLKSFLIST